MILRRVIMHVKDQNWTAVAIDFVIVVVGVFVGLQAQGWADERRRAANEEIYLHRLHAEVMSLADERSFYERIRAQNAAALREAVAILGGDAERAELTAVHCLAIVDMRYTTAPPTGIPTALELLSAGEINVIRSPGVRSALLDFRQQADRAEGLITEIGRTSLSLYHVYPEFFRIRGYVDLRTHDGYERQVECDVGAMRASDRFMNDLNELTFAYQIYNRRGVQSVSRSLGALHAALDAELSIDEHEGEEAG